MEFKVHCLDKAQNIKVFRFAIVATLAILVLFSYDVFSNGFSFDEFIVAGDKFVDKSKVPVKIKILKDSNGYDGQYYFRLALSPDARKKTEYGITIDTPPWRMQRIGYPLIVHVLSFGDQNRIPFLMVLVNIFGIFVLAWFARVIALQLGLSDWFAVAVLAWPGYVVTLQHDTTEILSVAFMAAAISALLSGRYGIYALVAAVATLTRETSILVFGAVFGVYGLDLLWSAVSTRSLRVEKLRRTALALAALLPFLVWRHEMALRWGATPAQAGGTYIGWPFAGIAQKLAECVAGTHVYSPNVLPNRIDTVLVFITVSAFVAVVAWVATRLPELLRQDATIAGLAIGWTFVAGLHVCLTSMNNGPWVDMTGYLRGCTEFWFLSMLMLAASRLQVPRGLGAAGLVLAAVVAVKNLM